MDNPSAKGLKEDAKALSYIQLACANGPLLHILTIENPTNAWAQLSRLYTPYRFSLEFILFKEFFRATLSSLGTVENFLVTIKRVSTSLKAKDLELPDKLVIAWTLYNLGPEYEAFVTSTTQSYRAESTALDQDDLFANLIDESRRLQDMDQNILFAKNRKPGLMPKCDYCNKKGHKKRHCWKLYPDLAPKQRDGNKDGDKKDGSIEDLKSQKPDTEETGVSDILFVSHSDARYIPNIVTTSELALAVKYSSKS